MGGPRERFDLPQIEMLMPRIRAILGPLEREARLFPGAARVGGLMSSSAKRALRVLETIGAADRPLGVTEIARRLSLPPGHGLSQPRCVVAQRPHRALSGFVAFCRGRGERTVAPQRHCAVSHA
jgi:hypothetical protein